MHMSDVIKENLERIRNEIDKASRKIELVAISKKVSSETLAIAYECGQRSFGESYVQEALPKIEALKDKGISWHFIGRLQKNKIKYLPEKFTLIHSLDNLDSAEELDKRFKEAKSTAHVLLQLNLSKEKSKG